jgi:hypothetical protein
MTKPLTAADVPFFRPADGGIASATRDFRSPCEGRYVLGLLEPGIQFDVDRLRREKHELVGELTVRCDLPGARTFEGTLSTADFNLSSARARQERAKLLADRSKAPEIDWTGLVEEFCQRVLAAERSGAPAVLLREVPKPPQDAFFDVEGFRAPKHLPTIIFGDGGTAKSYYALWIAGQLAQLDVRVGFFDWEFDGGAHRERLERLFGLDMPDVYYARCERPLVHESDRLRRLAREHNLQYAIFDSMAFAADGPPEAADVAARYFMAVRQIGLGSLHIAHITKAEGGDQKPFGSAFWHNGARSTWFVKLAQTSPDGRQLTLGVFNRKANVDAPRPAIGLTVEFSQDRTTFSRTNLAGVADLANSLPLWQRMEHALKGGALTLVALAEELDAKVDTVTKTVNRDNGRRFVKVPGRDGIYRIGLAERGTA